MLEAARLALCEIGILAKDERMPPFSVRMSGNLVFLVYPGGTRFYAVKVGTQSDLRREHDGLLAGHALFPQGVPKLLAWSHHRTFATLVSTGIDYLPLGAGQMWQGSPRLAALLEHFWSTCRGSLPAEAPIAASRRIESANRGLGFPIPEATWSRYCDSIAGEADGLSPVRQHGDFYVHNLGVRDDALVVLDWEDFGLESLPGLDLALLLLSLNDFSTDRLLENTRRGGAHTWILEAGCRGCAVVPATFVRLLPAYIALSSRMKHDLGYGDIFIERARSSLPEAIDRVQNEMPRRATTLC
jgi:hypothetical protein